MGGNRSRDVREDFAVKKGHNFFGSHGMRCGIHARPPFCAAALGEATCDPRCEVAVLAADTEGSSKSRSAVRARKRRSEEHTSELQSHLNLVCRLLLEKKNNKICVNAYV